MSVQVNKNASWIIKAILKQMGIIQSMNEWNSMIKKFETMKVYNFIKEEFPKVEWRHLLCRNPTRPRALYVFWLTCHNRLATKGETQTFDLLENNQCNFCTQVETVDHLFFSCPQMRSIWKQVLDWTNTGHESNGWNEELK